MHANNKKIEIDQRGMQLFFFDNGAAAAGFSARVWCVRE
jgi:hypothetical protein